MKTHPVPQNIMDVEFKLFGELTIRQFGYVAGGASVAFICYIIFDGLDIVRWPLVIFFAIIGLMLALFRVNDRPFEVWLANYLYAMFTSQRKVWKKSNKIPNILSSADIRKVSPGVSSVINKAPLSSVYTSPEEVMKNNVDVEEQDSLRALDSLFDNSGVTQSYESTQVKKESVDTVKEVSEVKGENPFLKEFESTDVVTSLPKVEASVSNTSPVHNNVSSTHLDLDDIIPETKPREDLMKAYDNKTIVQENLPDLNVSSNINEE
ncbi:MAG: PrgI family protein, partial [bacterium]